MKYKVIKSKNQDKKKVGLPREKKSHHERTDDIQ